MSGIEPYPADQIAESLPAEAREILSFMVGAVQRAGDIVRARYLQEQDIHEKGLGDLVSGIDVACDEALQEEIGRAYPGDAILSEELSPETSVEEGNCWVIDPLDATSALLFRAGQDLPSIMMARLQNGVNQYSAVYFPLSDEMFYAARGHGAYKGRERLHCNGDQLNKAWVEMNQYSDAQYESGAFRALRDNLRMPGGARLVSSSPPHSGVGARIAEGQKRLSAVVHDNNPDKVKQAPWDVLPVALIVEEAGGAVVNLANEPYDPFKPEPFIMAASHELAEAIIQRKQ